MGHRDDVLVVGAGPAGLAAAIAARQAGFSVTVVDSAKPPIDKACGEGLLPGTLAALEQLGINLDSRVGRVFRGLRFLDESTSLEARFFGENGIGVRRTVLHQKMVEHASAGGVELQWNSCVTEVSDSYVTAGGRRLRPRWIVGADGLHSRVRRWIGLDQGSRQRARFAQRRHYGLKPWTDCVEVYWGREMQAYVTPLALDETCVVLISRDPLMKFSEALKEFPRLAGSLKNAELTSVQRGAVTAMCKLDRVYRGNVALIGDASGSVDAITGEGLGLSFRQARALAEGMRAGNLEHYQSAHRRLARRPHAMASLLLLLDRFTPLRKRVLRGLARDPQLFDGMLTAHTQETSPGFLAEIGARLSWRLLTV